MIPVRENVALAPFTTFRIGGAARYFIEAQSEDDIREALEFARAKNLELFVLGGGSNILIADGGFNGVVIRMNMQSITSETHGDREWVTAGAGVSWDELVAWTITKNLSGLECLSGIPGSVGGAVVANLGAYGAQCSDTFVHARALDTNDRTEIKIIANKDCDFSYHDSMFGHTGGRYIILQATFALSTNPAAQPSYKDNRFNMAALHGRLGHTPTQEEVRESVLSMREQKGALIQQGRLSFKSAGSFFHMPFVSAEEYVQITERVRVLDSSKEEQLRPWAWKQTDGTYKIAPGFLLEYTEFHKGYVRGAAGISPLHTLSIINVAGASAKDIAELARMMQDAVEKIFGIHLEREVEYIGEVEK